MAHPLVLRAFHPFVNEIYSAQEDRLSWQLPLYPRWMKQRNSFKCYWMGQLESHLLASDQISLILQALMLSALPWIYLKWFSLPSLFLCECIPSCISQGQHVTKIVSLHCIEDFVLLAYPTRYDHWRMGKQKAIWLISWPYIQCFQIGQIAFCGVSVRTMQHHGGTHMWDVQLKEFFLLLYVCTTGHTR